MFSFYKAPFYCPNKFPETFPLLWWPWSPPAGGHSPLVQQLQFDASRRHHPPEAAVVPVDRQSEALIVL